MFTVMMSTICVTTLMLPTDRGTRVIPLSTIVRVEAISNYSKLYFTNGTTLVVARVLRWFEESLPPALFIRIHHKHLVNLLWLLHYDIADLKQVIVYSNDILPVARRRRKDAQNLLLSSPSNCFAEQLAI